MSWTALLGLVGRGAGGAGAAAGARGAAAGARGAGGAGARSTASRNKFFDMKYTQKDNLDKKYQVWLREFQVKGKELLTQQGCSLFHELARYSMPVRANKQLTSDEAIKQLQKENMELAHIAFTPVTKFGVSWWILRNHYSIAEFVARKTGFKYESETLNRWFKNGQYEILKGALMDWGGHKRPSSSSIPKDSQILDSADYSKFVKWKSLYKKEKTGKRYYVKNEASIQKIAQEKSIYNYASIVINGWLKASRLLGDRLDSGVRKINWPYGKSLGDGGATIKFINPVHIQLMFYNSYGNLNGIYNSQIQQTIVQRRTAIMEQRIKEFLDNMISLYNRIK